ncbi:MAG TPA: DUF881 domain-containing protein [Jatrophihabitans sp.]|jgi:uncharacterized protein YlxW (UPF0749 family)|nr:DUF881 domain-containing protein [Jatrophihabitans sp.]
MSTQPPPKPVESAQLLVDLVNNHLDPGYAAAAERRGPDAAPRWYDRPAVIVGCLLSGFILVVAYIHTHRGAPEATRVHDSLVTRVRAAQQAGDELANRVADLERQLSAALPKSGPLAKNLDLARLQAGLVAVSGPGMSVTLDEPPQPTASPTPGRGGTTGIGATNILTDRDVRSVVNELWRDGAEAISVNDIRLTPTSAIRFAGEAVLVDFQPITPPYEIRALGNPDVLSTNFAQSAVASRYQTLKGAENIGFSFTDEQQLTLPASASVKVRYAKVAHK